MWGKAINRKPYRILLKEVYNESLNFAERKGTKNEIILIRRKKKNQKSIKTKRKLIELWWEILEGFFFSSVSHFETHVIWWFLLTHKCNHNFSFNFFFLHYIELVPRFASKVILYMYWRNIRMKRNAKNEKIRIYIDVDVANVRWIVIIKTEFELKEKLKYF